MIKINSFTPVDNFTRKSWEFYDDHMVVKTKSLTFDYENEIYYEKIKSIQSKKMPDLNWLWASYIASGTFVVIAVCLHWLDIIVPDFDVIAKVFIACTLAMMLPAFRKYEYYAFRDAEKYFLTTIRVNHKNKASLIEAINLIKKKANIVNETYFDDSPPNDAPIFQFTEFDLADFWKKSLVSIYDDKIIVIDKSLAEKVTTVIKIDEFSGKIKYAKIGNNNWDHVWSYWLLFVCMTGIAAFTFFAEKLQGNYLFLNLFLGGLALLVPLFFFRYIKSEILIFYDKQDSTIFWAWVKSSNREMLKKITKFIKDKVESQK